MVLMVDVGQDDLLGSSDLYNEHDKMKENCETLERENSTTEKELVELADFLHEEVYQYDSLSTLAAQITW